MSIPAYMYAERGGGTPISHPSILWKYKSLATAVKPRACYFILSSPRQAAIEMNVLI